MGNLLYKSHKVVSLPNMEEIESYIKASTVTAKAGRKCVDGRYLPDQATGMIARPGGDGGYVMALMAVSKKKKLGLTPEQCFNAIYKAVEKDNGFCMHTDHDSDPDGATHKGLIGCGHMAKAATRRFCQDYDVNCNDVEKVINYARNINEISHRVNMVNLAGAHQEQGVLIIDSDEYSVLADNPELKRMYFVYDEQRDNAFIKNLVKEIAIEGVTFEEMKEESDLQLQATLQILAVNLPIYRVTFEKGQSKVTFAGRVEPKPRTTRSRLLKRLSFPKLPRFTHRNLSN
jgi:hypothetical protein